MPAPRYRAPASRVLVGDFGPIGRLGLRSLLGSGQFEFANGGNADEVLARVVEGETEVVVLDRRMPEGPTAVARIAAEHPDVKVIVCSLDESTMSVFPAHGAAAYESPLNAERLAAAMENVR